MEFSLPELRERTLEVLRRGGGSRPEVRVVGEGEKRYVLKDQNGCDAAFAAVLGPLLAGREARALRRLAGVDGVPKLIGRPDRRSVLMEYLPATPITRAADTDWAVFFPALARLLEAMHQAGVAHCDLRSPDNVLVGAAGGPVLVDFVANVQRGAAWNVPARWMFDMFCRVDHKALIKLKFLVAPELLAPGERQLLGHRSRAHRAVRRLGMAVRSVARRLFTRST